MTYRQLLGVAGIAFLTTCLPATSVAQLTLTLSPAGDGGTILSGSGTSIGTVSAPHDNAFDLFFSPGYLPNTANSAYFSNSASGQLTLGSTTHDFIGAWLEMDRIHMIGNGEYAVSGTASGSSLMATWTLSNLPFSTLVPGTYAGTTTGTSLVVVPEPSAIWIFGAVALAAGACRLKRRRQLRRSSETAT